MTIPSDIAIDIGGTWFRVMEGDQHHKVPTPSRLNEPATPTPDLYRRLVDMILAAAPSAGTVAISLGAATDDVDGHLLGSGPLWGDWQPPHNLHETLEHARPDLSWSIFNDVSCALAHFSSTVDSAQISHIGFLTVSSGIALRIADRSSGTILVDSAGMQGEVGHLPLPARRYDDLTVGLPCECGGQDHIASVSSGPGIRRTAERLGIRGFTTEWFIQALDEQDEHAQRLLDVATEPIAELLRTLWTTQPWLGVLGIGGGVAESMPDQYDRALRLHLASGTGYSALASQTWESGLKVLSRDDRISNLRGAQLLAQGYLLIKRAKTLTHER